MLTFFQTHRAAKARMHAYLWFAQDQLTNWFIGGFVPPAATRRTKASRHQYMWFGQDLITSWQISATSASGGSGVTVYSSMMIMGCGR